MKYSVQSCNNAQHSHATKATFAAILRAEPVENVPPCIITRSITRIREVILAWKAARLAAKSIPAQPHSGRNRAEMSAAELAEVNGPRSGGFIAPGDVLSGLVGRSHDRR